MAARKSRKRWIVFIGVAVLLCVAFWIVLHPVRRDPYAFLGGHPVRDVGVIGPGSWPASELRVYSWKGDWREVAKAARQDLPNHGLTEQPNGKADRQEVLFMSELIDGGLCGVGADTTVLILPGRNRPLRRSEHFTDDDPKWVTVLVSNDLDESWISVLRYTFFSMPE